MINTAVDGLVLGFEIGGALVLATSGLVALSTWFRQGLPAFWRGEGALERRLRFAFGHQIVLALEFFIAADIIRSVQAPSFPELGKLAVVVLIRTVLSYSLGQEAPG